MEPRNQDVRYLLFDVESVADPLLVASVRHPGEEIDPIEAIEIYRKELMEKKGSDFIPYTYQFPVSVVLAKIAEDFSLSDLVLLRFEDGGPEKIARRFWEGWSYYCPTLVTFNGRGFDLPLMELMAFRYQIPIPGWFNLDGRSFEQPRYRYNSRSHLDLCDLLTNCGATHFTGGLNLAAKLIAKPGKMGTEGDMVQDLFNEGRFQEIHDYCRCDVLDTYFVFLRLMVLCGKLPPENEHPLCQKTLTWLHQQSGEYPIYSTYLKAWKKRDKEERLYDFLRRRFEEGTGGE